MRIIARFALAVAAVALGFGSMGANAWTVSNVKGTYGFRFFGTDYAVTGKGIVATGIFNADGSGNITTTGSITYNDGGSVCTGTALKGGIYTVASDGEGTLTLQYTLSGTCPLTGPNFDFAIAIAAPNTSSDATTVQMSSTGVGDNNTPAVVLVGVANRL